MFQIIVYKNLINLPKLGSQSEQNLTLDYLKDIYFIAFLYILSTLG